MESSYVRVQPLVIGILGRYWTVLVMNSRMSSSL